MNLPVFTLNDENQEGKKKKSPFCTKQAILRFPSPNKRQGRCRVTRRQWRLTDDVSDVTTNKSDSKLQAGPKVVQCARVSLTPPYVLVTLRTTFQPWASVPLPVKDGARSPRKVCHDVWQAAYPVEKKGDIAGKEWVRKLFNSRCNGPAEDERMSSHTVL